MYYHPNSLEIPFIEIRYVRELRTSPIVGTTPRVTTANVNSGLGIALDNTGGTYLGKQLVHLSPLVWLMIACYCLSMILLGLAGVLHKRH